ncbi:MAG: tetratricopeptide repeat protein [Desulfovibrio sp.]|nr:tetratricopeptide repeat protein [Desulfovibrio sp.]MBI4961511.1 tetratricopeptide repeat protein [Desulfovibrio sp.]
MRPPAKTAWLLCLCILLASLTEVRAQSYSLSTDSSADLLTITFPKNAPAPVVLRTGAKRVEVLFPAGTKLKGVSGGSVKGRHVSNLSVADNVLVVETEGDTFGFVASPKGDKSYQLQLFYDPAGSRWKPQTPDDAKAPEQPQPDSAKQAAQPPTAPSGDAGQAKPDQTARPGGGVVGKIDFPGSQPAPSVSPQPASTGPAAQGSQPAAPAGAQTSTQVPQAQPGQTAPADKPAPQTKPQSSGQGVSGTIARPGPQAQPGQPAAQSAPVAQPGQSPAPKTDAQPQAVAVQQPSAPAAQSPPVTAEPPQTGQPPRGEVRGAISMQQALQESPNVPPQPGAAKPPAGAVSGQIAQPAPQPEKTSPPPVAQEQAAQTPAPGPQAPPQAEQPEPFPPVEEAKQPEKTQGDTLEDKTYIVSGQQSLAHGDYDKALIVAKTLLAKPELSKDLREEALYLQAEAVFHLNKDKMPELFLETSDILQQALNFNTSSMKLPRALIKLGYINLRQGNLPEARAYFNLMRTKYPMDEEIPLIDVYWGEYYLDLAKQGDPKGNYERASQSFREVLQKHPESRFARDAALGLSKAQFELQQYAEASKIIEYVDKRWPRYYIENPTMRRVAADIAYKLGEFDKAKDDYLWFYNLVPGDSSNDLVLARLGDVSMRLGKKDPAREFYDMAIRMYPGKEGALMAMMRLAEQGIHDAPTLQEMFKAFADPKDIKPDKIYEIIVNEYPKSILAPLALLKLAMWKMYKEEYPETLDLVGRFTKSYPGDVLENQAIEVGVHAFGKMIGTLLEEMNYKRIQELWQAYPYLVKRADVLSDRERLGVALALYYQGAPREALAMAEPYLDMGPTPDAQKALALMFTIYRENQDWQSIINALRKVSSWKLADNPRRALEFAQAMALEHTGEHARSRLLWAKLAADNQLDPAKRAYAVYYQARTAYDRKDFDKALMWAMDSRLLFKEAAKDDGKARDALLLMIEANQAAGRYREALALCDEYEGEAPENSAEWASNRLRMANLNRMLGNMDLWRKILVDMRDSLGDSLYGKLASTELATKGIEERAGKLTSPK